MDDWPDGIPNYSVEQAGYGSIDSKKDLQTTFQVAYNQKTNLFYIRVEIVGSEYIEDTNNKAINTVDRVLLFLDPVHHPLGGSSVIFEYSELYKDLGEKSNEWNPYLSTLNWDDSTVSTSRKNNITSFE